MDMDLAFSCSMAALTARVENGNEWKLGGKKTGGERSSSEQRRGASVRRRRQQ